MVETGGVTSSSFLPHEGLIQRAWAAATAHAAKVHTTAHCLEELRTEVDGQDATPASALLEERIDKLAECHDGLIAQSTETQRPYIEELHALSPQLSHADYFGAAAFLHSLNPYLLEQANDFRSQVSRQVARLIPGERLVVWGEADERPWGVYGGRIVEVRRTPPDTSGGLGIELVLQPQHPANQAPIKITRTIAKMLDSRNEDGQLRLGWYVSQAEVVGLARRLFDPTPVWCQGEELLVPRRIENLARLSIAAWAAEVDLFATSTFSISDQTAIVEELSQLFLTTREGSFRWLAIDSLEALGEWTPDFLKQLMRRMIAQA